MCRTGLIILAVVVIQLVGTVHPVAGVSAYSDERRAAGAIPGGEPPAAAGRAHQDSRDGLRPCSDHNRRPQKALEILQEPGDSPLISRRGDDPLARTECDWMEDSIECFAGEPDDGAPETWTFLFYNDADFTNAYNPFSDFISTAQSRAHVNVLMLEDRWFGPCRLLYIGGDRYTVVLENWGEADMGHYNTLRKFIAFGKEHYPADRYFLALYDHGGGWMGACADVTNNSWLTMNEIYRAVHSTGGVNIIAFTAPCMMGALESVYQLRNCTEVYIGSEDLSGYAAWHGIMGDVCDILNASSGLTTASIARKVVRLVAQNTYWASQQFGGEEWITMSAVKSQDTKAVAHQLDVLSRYAARHMAKLFDTLKPAARGAWKMGRGGELNVGETDLYHFAKLYAETAADPFVVDHLNMLIGALDEAVIAEYHGWAQVQANGLSVYFPQYRRDYAQSYARSNLDFAENTGWDEFLEAFYEYDARPVGRIAGTVSADLPVPRTPLLGVTMSLYEAHTGDLLRAAATDGDGGYAFGDVRAGDYIVSIVTPLGYETDLEEFAVTVTGGAVVGVDADLHRIDVTGNARGVGYWKHQVAAAAGGYGRAGAETLCGYLDLIAMHFNNNALKSVVIYEPPESASCGDKLETARHVLMVSGASSMACRARQHVMALLLNLAAGNIAPYAKISADGATVSQAITFCNGLLLDDTARNDGTAKDIAEMINESREVPAGMIPLTTPDIAYAPAFGEDESAQDNFLDQNYPNPFNPSTTIRFSLTEPGRVRLAVYDVSGRPVLRLIDEEMSPGVHTASVDAAPLPSGVYYYRLETKQGVETRKMVLIK